MTGVWCRFYKALFEFVFNFWHKRTISRLTINDYQIISEKISYYLYNKNEHELTPYLFIHWARCPRFPMVFQVFINQNVYFLVFVSILFGYKYFFLCTDVADKDKMHVLNEMLRKLRPRWTECSFKSHEVKFSRLLGNRRYLGNRMT